MRNKHFDGRRVDSGASSERGTRPHTTEANSGIISRAAQRGRCGAWLPLIQKLDTNLIIPAGAAPASRSAVHRSPRLWAMTRRLQHSDTLTRAGVAATGAETRVITTTSPAPAPQPPWPLGLSI